MIYSLEELKSYFSLSQIEQGLHELEKQAFTAPNIQRNGQLVTAIIPTDNRPLRVYIQVQKNSSDDLTINGECTCATSHNCSHVVAVLLKTVVQKTGISECNHSLDIQTSRINTGAGEYPADVHHRLLYILTLNDAESHQLQIKPISARLLDNNNYTDERPYKPEWIQRGIPPRFLLKTDVDILTVLAHAPNKNSLKDMPGNALLDVLLKTGRCHYKQIQTKAIQLGEAVEALPSWVVDDVGNQTIHWLTVIDELSIFYHNRLWYLDTGNNLCGLIKSNLPDELVAALVTLPPIPPEEINQIINNLNAQFPQAKIPAAKQITVKRLPFIKPQPHLQLHNYNGTLQGDIATLSFQYHGIQLGSKQSPAQLNGDQLLRIERDHKAEGHCIEQLIGFGFQLDNYRTDKLGSYCFNLPGESNNWLVFQSQHLSKLQEMDWQIEINPNFRHHLADVDQWFTDITSTGNGLFNVTIGIEVAGSHLNLLPALKKISQELANREDSQIDNAHPIILPLEDGRMLPLPFARVRFLLDTLLELQEGALSQTQQLQLNRFQLTRLAELDGAAGTEQQLHWLGDTECKQLAKKLQQVNCIPESAPPINLKTELRIYQQQGLNWLQFLRAYNLAGILADDMGLGKTIQILAHLLLEKEQGRADAPSLIIVPTSLISNWRKEVQRFTPTLKLLILHGSQRHKLFNRISQHDLILTTYPLLVRDLKQLQQHNYHLLVLDEAQVVKNPKAKASHAIRQLSARHRICLTGTPMENHLGELWSLFDFILPGLLGTARQFHRHCRLPIERHADQDAANRLQRRIKPFLLRRTKQLVATELPPKTTILQSVELIGQQRELYEAIRLSVQQRIGQAIDKKGVSGSQIIILDALLKLRQVCCDPGLVKLESARRVEESAKMQLLMEMLPEMIEEGRRILLFSQFTTMLAIIEQAVDKAGIEYVKLTGSTRDRSTPVEQFQSGDIPLFLISLKAGGVGLNLTAADTVIHFDPWWNPAAENQASDRAHRIGQKNPVFVYKFICEGTVEERIQTMQARKQRLADGLYEQKGAVASQWTEDDLAYLFGALK